jgi:hypothetical protein
VSTGPKTHVHMVSATAESADPNVMPLVCLHGFAHGTSVFYTAAAPLAEAYAGPVFILDMCRGAVWSMLNLGPGRHHGPRTRLIS